MAEQGPLPYHYVPHPHLAKRLHQRPPQSTDTPLGFNGRVAVFLTRAVGTMTCAYLFAVWALLGLPSALGGGLFAMVTWVSQTLIQLVMLSVIMVGQNILAQASDKRAVLTFQDTEALLHEISELQRHLAIQDAHLHALTPNIEEDH